MLVKTLPQLTTFVDILGQLAKQQPDTEAFVFLRHGQTETVELSLTYRELEKQAKTIAVTLQHYCKPGDRVLLVYQAGLEFVGAFLGCLYAGVVAVPVYPPRRQRRQSTLHGIMADADADVVLTTESLCPRLKEYFSGLDSLQYVTTDALDLAQATQWRRPDLSGDAIAFLQYTSGSTGAPKGVMVSHDNLIYNSAAIYERFSHTDSSQGVIWLPPYHDMGLIGGILQPLYGGFPVTLMAPVDVLQKPLRWLEAISKYRATTSGGPNFVYDLCVERISAEQKSALDLSCWQVAFNGAEPIRAETLQRFSTAFAECGFHPEAFYPCYGMAETTLIVTGGESNAAPVLRHCQASALNQNQFVQVDHPQPGSYTLVSCGQAITNQKIVIVDTNTKHPCLPGSIGEIWVTGKTVAQGYWNNPQATQDTFSASLSDIHGASYLRTGDLGFLDSDGELFVTGRLKDIIVIRGRNYYPQDIEQSVIVSHPALQTNGCAAFTADIDDRECLVVLAEIERRYLHNLHITEIVSAIRTAVSNDFELQVHSIVLLKPYSLPKTSSGKIRHQACREAFLQGSLNQVGIDQLDSVPQPLMVAIENELVNVNTTGISTDVVMPESPVPQAATSGKTLRKMDEREIQGWLQAQLAHYLKVSPQQLSMDEPLASYGLDSSVAVTVTGELAELLGCDLDPAFLFWEFPTIKEMAIYLAELDV